MFVEFSKAVHKQFKAMGTNLFTVDVSRDEMWGEYLAAFPAGTDPIFRERTEHDCSCCRHFVRDIAHVVSIHDGVVSTVWDVEAPYPYDVVSARMGEYVRSKAVKDIFMADRETIGTASNREIIGGTVHTWNHFHVGVHKSLVTSEVPTALSKARSNAGVFQRGLDEISSNALMTVSELIDSNSLYRGAEVRVRVDGFLKHKKAYMKLNSDLARNLYVWENLKSPAALLKNSALGTLLIDLSEGEDIEVAVRKYDAMTAPENYKRTTAIITPNMVKAAVKKLEDMGLEGAVKRRHARITDISVNDVLFVDNAVQGQMKDSITDLLMGETKGKTLKGVPTQISANDFVDNIVPKATTLDLILQPANVSNFMSLTAPQEEDTGKLFKWDNDFAWAYDGDVADSLKQKVKRAGGDVSAVMRVSLGWYNGDDLDIHVIEPDKNHIYFGNKVDKLDVDMNASGPKNSTDPVENVRWKRTPNDGIYTVYVDNFCKRENQRTGFEVEVEFNGELHQFSYGGAVGKKMSALKIEVVKGKLHKVTPSKHMKTSARTVEKWGISTGEMIPVDSMMFSPNHWEGNSDGQKHLFFILRGCKNDSPVRGMFNEHLRPELHEHRKVFEVLGGLYKCEPSEDQLSGVGFTAARNDTATVVVNKGKAYSIQF